MFFSLQETVAVNVHFVYHCAFLPFDRHVIKKNMGELSGKDGIIPGVSVVKIRLQCRRRRFDSWAGKIPWRRKW